MCHPIKFDPPHLGKFKTRATRACNNRLIYMNKTVPTTATGANRFSIPMINPTDMIKMIVTLLKYQDATSWMYSAGGAEIIIMVDRTIHAVVKISIVTLVVFASIMNVTSSVDTVTSVAKTIIATLVKDLV